MDRTFASSHHFCQQRLRPSCPLTTHLPIYFFTDHGQGPATHETTRLETTYNGCPMKDRALDEHIGFRVFPLPSLLAAKGRLHCYPPSKQNLGDRLLQKRCSQESPTIFAPTSQRRADPAATRAASLMRQCGYFVVATPFSMLTRRVSVAGLQHGSGSGAPLSPPAASRTTATDLSPPASFTYTLGRYRDIGEITSRCRSRRKEYLCEHTLGECGMWE